MLVRVIAAELGHYVLKSVHLAPAFLKSLTKSFSAEFGADLMCAFLLSSKPSRRNFECIPWCSEQ